MSNYGKVFGAFFCAFLTHAYGSWLADDGDMKDWFFFMGQAVAIWFEETTILAATSLEALPHSQVIRKLVGYTWTFAWMSYSLMVWNNAAAQAGYWVDQTTFFGFERRYKDILESGY